MIQRAAHRLASALQYKDVSKTATRRAPGRSAAEFQAAVESFLKASKQPALLEPGEEMIPISGRNFTFDVRDSRVTLQAWDERRNLVRRVVAIHEETRGRMELVVERFAGKRGPLFLLDLARPASAEWSRRGTRLVFRERFRDFLSREFPAWKVAELSTEPDLEHTLSPAYPQALVKRGTAGLAAIAAPAGGLSASGVLSFGLIWLNYLRTRERRLTIESLLLFLPAGEERTTALRLRHLNPTATQFALFAYDESGHSARLDPRDVGNLDTKLEICRHPSSAHQRVLERLTAIEGVERVETGDGEVSLRVRGLEFARTEGVEFRFGLGERAVAGAHNLAECEQLARNLAGMRNAQIKGGDLYVRDAEAWLESQVRSNLAAVDPALVPAPIYGQVPAFAAGDRGILDLLAVDRTGRLAVIELKASPDLHLPLQALDYWMRVRWHLERDEFRACGYFPGTSLRNDPPRLVLVAPALEFHPTTESILRHFSPEIEVERIGLGIHWRSHLEVMFRLRGAERPA